MVKTTISQNLPQKIALKIIARLVESLGEKRVYRNTIFYDFPKPEAIVEAGIDKLYSPGLSRRKAEYVYGVARLVLEGCDIESLRKKNIGEAIRELKRIKGVGSWTAKLALMASTGNLSLDLLEDKAVSRGLTLPRL